MQMVRDSYVGKQADSGDEGGGRGGSVEQLVYPRGLATPRPPRHHRLSFPRNLPVLCAHVEGQTKVHV